VFTKRAGTGGHGYGLPGSRVVRAHVGWVEFGVMTLTRPLTRQVGRDGLGPGGYMQARVYYYF
jgi:hypothetical protein